MGATWPVVLFHLSVSFVMLQVSVVLVLCVLHQAIVLFAATHTKLALPTSSSCILYRSVSTKPLQVVSFASCRAHAPVSSRQRTRTQSQHTLEHVSYHNTHMVCHITTHTSPSLCGSQKLGSTHMVCHITTHTPSLCGSQKLGSTMIESEQMHRELHAMLAGFKRTYSGACRICVFGITPSTDLSLRTIATRKCVCVCVCG